MYMHTNADEMLLSVADHQYSYSAVERKELFMEQNFFINADELRGILGVSRGHAYKLIHRMNDELKEKGYMTIAGKIPRKYFETRYYGYSAS